jgi:hypothetical protein
MRRVVWLVPDPVRAAVTATTGLDEEIIVVEGPISRKSGPSASTREARRITCSWETSL